MANLLAKTRKITSILQRSVDSLEGDLPYNNMAAQLADIIDCNAAIVNGGGALLGFAMKYKTNFQKNTHVVSAVFMILKKTLVLTVT